MQTTLRIDDDVYRRAKMKAGELGVSLTRFFEEAVEARLAGLEAKPGGPIRLPVSSVAGPPMSEDEFRRRALDSETESDLAKL